METGFQTELESMMLQLAACKLDYTTWTNWWSDNLGEVLATLSRGDELRIKPTFDSAYEWDCLLFSQRGAKRWLEKMGIPYTDSDRYETETQKAEKARKEAQTHALMQEYQNRTAALAQGWADYKEQHGLSETEQLFDINTVLGYTAVDPQGKTKQDDIQKLSLKFLMKKKIAPIATAYGMKWIRPQTFVRERGGVVARIKFQGYFRGGGYDHMLINIFPAYMPSPFDFNYGMVSQDLIYTERYHEMKANWRYIHGSRWSRRNVKNHELEESLQFDRIARFLAQDLLPAFDQVPSLVFFCTGTHRLG